MFTQWEIEGQLRELHPLRERARERRAAAARLKRYAGIVGTLFIGALLVAVLGMPRSRAAALAPGVRQWGVWGLESVRGYRPSELDLIPGTKRDRGNSYSWRAREAREAVRRSQR